MKSTLLSTGRQHVHVSLIHPVSDVIETPPLSNNNQTVLQSLDIDDCICPPYFPSFVAQILHERGVHKLHEWQRECLYDTTCLDGCTSLLYALPTSGGKTLVAELLLLRALLVSRKSAIMILPFVSLVTEKMRWLHAFVDAAEANDAPFCIEGLYQNQGRLPERQQQQSISKLPTLYVATMEKANLLINTLYEQGSLDANTLGCVVMDEMHMMDDAHRGYLLEWMVTKVRFATTATSSPPIPLIAMSATMLNLNQVAHWMGATAYCRNFRPVPLHEYIINGRDLLQVARKDQHPNAIIQCSVLSTDKHVSYNTPQKSGHWLWHHSNYTTPTRRNPHMARATILIAFDLVYQIAPFQSTLLFCASRVATRDLALELTHLLSSAPPHTYESYMDYATRAPNIQPYDGDNPSSIFHYNPSTTFASEATFNEAMRQIQEARECLARRLETGVDNDEMEPSTTAAKRHYRNGVLARCVRQGVAWHNADLSARERALLEDAYRAQVLFAICATSTLAAGVNLPARRVILLSPKMGKQPLSVRDYRQMVGRAGRAGLCEMGESFLLIPPVIQANATTSSNNTTTPPFKFDDTRVEHNTGWCAWRAIQLAARPLEPVRSALLQRDDSSRETFVRLRQLNVYWSTHGYFSNGSGTSNRPSFDMSTAPIVNMLNANTPVFSRFCMNERLVGSISKPVLISGTHLERLMLEWIASGMCVTLSGMRDWIHMSWYAHCRDDEKKRSLQRDEEMTMQRMQQALAFLQHIGMVEVSEATTMLQEPCYRTTPFGDATYKSPFALHVVIHAHESIERMARLSCSSTFGTHRQMIMDFTNNAQAAVEPTTEDEADESGRLLHLACWLSIPPCNASLGNLFPSSQPTAVTWLPEVKASLSSYPDTINLAMGVDLQLLTDIHQRDGPTDGDGNIATPRYRRLKQLQEHLGWDSTLHFVLGVILLHLVRHDATQETTVPITHQLADRFDLAVGDVEYLAQASVQHAHYLVAFVHRNAWPDCVTESPLFTHTHANLTTMLALIETRLQALLSDNSQ